MNMYVCFYMQETAVETCTVHTHTQSGLEVVCAGSDPYLTRGPVRPSGAERAPLTADRCAGEARLSRGHLRSAAQDA